MTTMYKRWKRYWRRRGYERLPENGRRRRKPAVEELGARGTKRRRWRLCRGKKLKLRCFFTPKKYFIGLRDAYVKMMLGIANTRAIGFGGCSNGFFTRPVKEYDENILIEICRSILIAQRELEGAR